MCKRVREVLQRCVTSEVDRGDRRSYHQGNEKNKQIKIGVSEGQTRNVEDLNKG